MKSHLSTIKWEYLSATICLAAVIAMAFLSIAGCEKNTSVKGKEAYEKKQWSNAVEHLSQIKNDDSKYREAQDLLSSATIEIASEKLSKALELSETNDQWQLVDSLLHGFPKTHPRYGEARKLIEDVHGWNTLYWGMTELEALRTLGDKGFKLKEKEEYGEGKRIPTIGISEIQVGTFTYEIRCFFDSTDRLDQVTIQPRQQGSWANFTSIGFSDLEEGLIVKYGPPTYKNEDEYTFTSSWNLKHTTIYLQYMEMKFIKRSYLSLMYSKPDKSKNTNL